MPITRKLRDHHLWFRVADTGWSDPLDPDFARRYGGRWNPPDSFPTLYLNEDVATARTQIHRMLEGSPVRAEDLEDQFVLISATLPTHQVVVDATSDDGLDAVDLPPTYPLDGSGAEITHDVCQTIGADAKADGLRGVHARSAATADGAGRELAWFPARASSKAHRVGDPTPFSTWFFHR